ncbi:MAG TPA: O-antigen ligase family protein [Dehalococcoidia bacterium]|nr:O-antigen ligase family protein [Dehalococcoidia bacterium]
MSEPAVGALAAAPGRTIGEGFSLQKLLTRPWLPLLPFLALPLLGGTSRGVDMVILSSEVLFLLMALQRPVWLIGAIALSEMTTRNYLLPLPGFHMSARLFISIASLLIVLPYLNRAQTLGPRARTMLLTVGAFIGVTTIANVIALPFSGLSEFLRFIIAGLVAVTIVPLVVRNKQDLRDLGMPLLVIATLSAAIALGQRLVGPELMSSIPNAASPAPPAYWEGRAMGLSENPIYLANDLMAVLLFGVGMFLMRRENGRAGWLLPGMLLLLLLGIYFSQTRSWVYGAAGASVMILLVLRGRMQKEFLLLLLLAGGIGLYYAQHSNSRYAFNASDSGSAAIRPVLWSAALNMALDHPIVGVGYGRFMELAPQYEDYINPSLLQNQDAGTALGKYDPHNDYLNVWASFGSLALLLYTLVIFQTGANFASALRGSADPFLRGVALGGLAALVAFAINSLFHNLIESTLTVWLLAGLSLAVLKLVRQESAPGSAEAPA